MDLVADLLLWEMKVYWYHSSIRRHANSTMVEGETTNIIQDYD